MQSFTNCIGLNLTSALIWEMLLVVLFQSGETLCVQVVNWDILSHNRLQCQHNLCLKVATSNSC